MKFDKQFKEAIINLPESEKNKLLLRLFKRDVGLVNKLHFELLSDETVDDKRVEMAALVTKKVRNASDSFYSLDYLK
ncbi:hypothetical protein [Aquimarina agarivorans]|uniref:hypothetical protein n=1 Tax=Aquimarina agarivorans TaxID=980584 RepID=UPI000248ED6F|nr:hypothetical protein [Aquimarina agarivorans]